MNITNTVLKIRERDNDMNKKWLTFIISFLLVAAIIGAGGKMYMDKRAEQKEEGKMEEDKKAEKKEAEKIEAERMSVEALKNTFEDIKSVEFEKSGYDAMTGAYGMFVKMTNKEGKTVSFTYNYEKNKPKETRGYILEDEE